METIPQPIPSSPTPNSKLPLILIGLVFLIILSVTGGFFLGKQLYSPNSQSITTPISIAEPTLTPGPTANWEIYASGVLGFSFSYPQELSFIYDQLKDYTEAKAPSGNLLLQNFDGSKPRQETASDFQLALFVSKDDGTSLENYPKQWEGEFGKLQTETITIGGIKAIKGFSGQKYRVVPTVWFTLTNILYTIQLSNPNSTNKSWFDQILSTFKFLDQNNAICNIDQEYQNTAVNPVTCQCPDGSEWKILSTSFGPCPADKAKDCPQTIQKCSPKN